ncbi:hypothetical protein IT072_00780 [Leifsonia sp. ZF2019]|uniref:hypothetical protein n=1 Tax=Leifsonia sp. ZF2019 TaxID=2781978 RepID=UPI001CBE5809|nr:hypothetical protein [Leifsonia sp. ZF2019]UAJ79672.1 hypothetical protein IT072_00780 [Leifsonia sp. ZF2019]
MTRTTTFRARLLREGEAPRTVTERAPSDAPPRTLRRRASAGGMYDIYALLDADGWPATATYSFVQTLSPARSAADD